jgi:hypothetical protein
MEKPDFEIETSLHADELTAHISPDPLTQAEGEFLVLHRREKRRGSRDGLQPYGTRRGVVIEKRMLGKNVQR